MVVAMSDMLDQIRAFFYYSLKHLFAVEFGIRVLFIVFIILLLLYVVFRLSFWILRKVKSVFKVAFDFISCDVVLPACIIISEKFAYKLGSMKWQNRADKLKKRIIDKQEKRSPRKSSNKAKHILTFAIIYLTLIAYIVSFHYLLDDRRENYTVFFIPENMILRIEDYLINTLFYTDEYDTPCFFHGFECSLRTFLILGDTYVYDDETIEEYEVMPNHGIYIVDMFQELQIVNIETETTIIFDFINGVYSMSYYGVSYPLNCFEAYRFTIFGEEVKVIRIQDTIFFSCEHHVWMFYIQKNVRVEIDEITWTFPAVVTEIPHPIEVTRPPIFIASFFPGYTPILHLDRSYNIEVGNVWTIGDFLTITATEGSLLFQTWYDGFNIIHEYRRIVFICETDIIWVYP